MGQSNDNCVKRGGKWAALLLLLLAVGSATAAMILGTRAPVRPTVRLLPEVVDLGQLGQLENKQVDLVIHNESNQPVEVTKVSTSCGCTVPAWTARTLQARERVQLPVFFDTGHGDGVVKRTVTVYAHDKGAPGGVRALESRLHALVRPDLVIEPRRLDFGTLAASQTATASVRIIPHGMQDLLKLSNLRTSHESLAAKVQPSPPGHEAQLFVTFTPSLYPNRFFSGELRVVTNAPGMPSVGIPVSAEIVRRLEFTPPDVYLTVVDSSVNSVSADVRVSLVGNGTMPSIKLVQSRHCFAATLRPTDDPSILFIRIDVQVDNGVRAFDEKLTILEMPTEQPLTTVPVRFLDIRPSESSH